MKKLFFLTLFLLSSTSLINASANFHPRCSPPYKPEKSINFHPMHKGPEKQKKPCTPCKEREICPAPSECCTDTVAIGEPRNCAYNAPARIDPACGLDLCLTLSFLYWQPKEKGIDLGLDKTSSGELGISPTYSGQKAINMESDYHPAFKIGAGMSFCHDDWTMCLEYARFASHDSYSYKLKSKCSYNHYLDTLWLSENMQDYIAQYTGTFSAFKARWSLVTNIIDLELGRPFYQGRKVLFKPFFGLRGGTIDQKYLFTSASPGSSIYATSTNKSDSWLLGPRAGLDTDWMVGCHYRLFGNIATALFYQQFDVKEKQSFPKQPGVQANEVFFSKGKNNVSNINPNVEIELGLGYGSYFSHNRRHFDLALAYSFNYFWHQNLLRTLSDADKDFGDLTLHGLTISARLDF